MKQKDEIRVISYIRREDGSEVALAALDRDEQARAARQLLLRFLGAAFRNAEFSLKGAENND